MLINEGGCAKCGEGIKVQTNKDIRQITFSEKYVPTVYCKTDKGQEVKAYLCKSCFDCDIDETGYDAIRDNIVANEIELCKRHSWDFRLVDPIKEYKFVSHRKQELITD